VSFRRQRVRFGYIAGFSCRERDAERDAILAERGIVTRRFANDQFTSDTQYVLSPIWEAAHRPDERRYEGSTPTGGTATGPTLHRIYADVSTNPRLWRGRKQRTAMYAE
jgi:hypothetical protein